MKVYAQLFLFLKSSRSILKKTAFIIFDTQDNASGRNTDVETLCNILAGIKISLKKLKIS